MAIAASIATRSASLQRPSNPLWGNLPRETNSKTVMPSGMGGDCGRIASLRATAREACERIGCPSSSTTPPDGVINRASAESSVDFPDPFGPTSAVSRPGEIAALTCFRISALP
ncbi:hypothetical protein D3C87_1679680 [compost metagenome]